MDDETRLDSREVAERLQVSPYTIKSWRRKGVGPGYIKIEGRVYYTEQQLANYLRERTVTR
jgi:DNA-binding transcriptional MerR regulator